MVIQMELIGTKFINLEELNIDTKSHRNLAAKNLINTSIELKRSMF